MLENIIKEIQYRILCLFGEHYYELYLTDIQSDDVLELFNPLTIAKLTNLLLADSFLYLDGRGRYSLTDSGLDWKEQLAKELGVNK